MNGRARFSLVALLAIALCAPAARAGINANWQVQLDTPDQVGAPGVAVVYSGHINNFTLGPLLLNGDVDFTTSPAGEQFTIDWAPELLALDLEIPTSGYAGPIFVIRWNPDAMPGSSGIGNLIFARDGSAFPSDLETPFRFAMTGDLPFCDVGTGVTAGANAVAAVDSAGLPAIVYNDPVAGTLSYAKFDGGSWSVTPIASGIGGNAAPALALDGLLIPQVVYYDAIAGDLVHAWNPGTGWQTEIVDSSGNTGAAPALAVDALGALHVSYYDVTHGDLRYAHWSGGVWSRQLADSVGDVGRTSSIVADDLGRPFISYYDATARQLKLAYVDGGWRSDLVDSAEVRGEFNSMARNGDQLAIAYRDATPGAPALRFASGKPGSWSREVADSVGNPGFGVSLVLDQFGQPRVAGFDSLSGDVRIATRIESAWTTQRVAASGTARLSLGHSALDEPFLSFVDGTTGELRFAAIHACNVSSVPVAPRVTSPLLELRGSRPNPFTSSTTIVFALARAADVRMRVYDPAGRLVAEPYRGATAAGVHEILWNGRGLAGQRLAPGHYLYEVRSGAEARVGRLVLLR